MQARARGIHFDGWTVQRRVVPDGGVPPSRTIYRPSRQPLRISRQPLRIRRLRFRPLDLSWKVTERLSSHPRLPPVLRVGKDSLKAFGEKGKLPTKAIVGNLLNIKIMRSYFPLRTLPSGRYISRIIPGRSFSSVWAPKGWR